MKVLHILSGLWLGGAETLLYRLLQRNSGFEHEVICMGERNYYSTPFEQLGIVVHHLNMTSVGSALRGTPQLNRLVRSSGADVAQCWMYRANTFGGLAAKAAGIPVAWGIHCSSLEPLNLVSRANVYLGGLLARRVPDFVINCSTKSAELHEKLGYDSAPGAVIHNGYDANGFFIDDAARRRTRRSLGIDDDTFVLGSVARWHPQKDIPNLLRAVEIVVEQGIRLRLLLMGRGLDLTDPGFAAAARDCACGLELLPLGPRADLAELVRALDVHVLSSCGAEAFPNVVAETMLSGVPNVVTDIGDSALMVGDTGWVVPPRDPRRLADAIIEAYGELKESPSEWQGRRLSSRARIAENFTFEAMAEAYEGLWLNLIEGGNKLHARDS